MGNYKMPDWTERSIEHSHFQDPRLANFDLLDAWKTDRTIFQDQLELPILLSFGLESSPAIRAADAIAHDTSGSELLPALMLDHSEIPSRESLLAQDSTKVKDDQYFKPEVPATALRELNRYFPQFHSSHNRLGKHADLDMFDHLNTAANHDHDFLTDKLRWFQMQVTNHANWDFKDYYKTPGRHHLNLPSTEAPLWVQNYGNFHYGAIAYAMGFARDFAQVAAGDAQLGGSGGKPINSPEGATTALTNLAKALASENYGDAGYNDQFWIRKGWEWAREHRLGVTN
jgi:hypothetical protein